MQGNVDKSMRMVRVLMNRLNRRDILGYTVDEHDSRVYHYCVLKQKEECVKEKSRKFVDSYFSGSRTNAMAALLQSFALTDEQIKELEEILEKSKERGVESFLCRNNAEGDICIVFGGFYKLHALGSIGEICYYERDSEDAVVQILDERMKENWHIKLFKLL